MSNIEYFWKRHFIRISNSSVNIWVDVTVYRLVRKPCTAAAATAASMRPKLRSSQSNRNAFNIVLINSTCSRRNAYLISPANSYSTRTWNEYKSMTRRYLCVCHQRWFNLFVSFTFRSAICDLSSFMKSVRNILACLFHFILLSLI